MYKIFVLLSFSFLIACGTNSSENEFLIDFDNPINGTVTLGVSKAELVSKLGEPSQKVKCSEYNECIKYSYNEGGLVFFFSENKLVRYTVFLIDDRTSWDEGFSFAYRGRNLGEVKLDGVVHNKEEIESMRFSGKFNTTIVLIKSKDSLRLNGNVKVDYLNKFKKPTCVIKEDEFSLAYYDEGKNGFSMESSFDNIILLVDMVDEKTGLNEHSICVEYKKIVSDEIKKDSITIKNDSLINEVLEGFKKIEYKSK